MLFKIFIIENWQNNYEIINLLIQLLSILLQGIQTLVVIIGIPFLIRQLREQVRATRVQSEDLQLSTYMQLMAESSAIDEMLISDNDLSDFYDQNSLPSDLGDSWESLNNKFKKHYLEQAFLLWNRGWMDNIDYRAMLTHLREIMGLRSFQLWWPILKPYFRADFASYIDNLKNKDDSAFYNKALLKSSKNI